MSEESRKVALVTGASRGIGAAIAGVLADAGLIVVGTATSGQEQAKSMTPVITRWSRVCAQCNGCNQHRCLVG